MENIHAAAAAAIAFGDSKFPAIPGFYRLPMSMLVRDL